MVDGVSSGGGGIGRASIDAALKQMRARAQELKEQPVQTEAPATSFADTVKEGVRGVDQEVKAADDLHVRALKGDLDFHEISSQLKRTEMSFEFAMQVRNKFIDAYREVMRMNV